MNYLEQVKNAIGQLHHCEADHLETVPITETFQGKTVWEGEVEIYGLRGHPKAEKLFAWGYENDQKPSKMQFVTVLSVPPISTPQKAVQAFIVSQQRKG